MGINVLDYDKYLRALSHISPILLFNFDSLVYNRSLAFSFLGFIGPKDISFVHGCLSFLGTLLLLVFTLVISYFSFNPIRIAPRVQICIFFFEKTGNLPLCIYILFIRTSLFSAYLNSVH